MKLRDYYPVVIIGAGPTGLMLANLLGGEGIDLLLVERNASTVQEPRAVSIDDESLRTLQAVGLADVALRRMIQGYGSHYFDAAGRCFAKVEPASREFGFRRRNAFRQQILESQLLDGLTRFRGVAVRFTHTFESQSQDAQGVTVRVLTPDGSPHDVRCDFLVGSDGASSKVRESIGIRMGGTTFNERWLIVDMHGTPDRFRHTRVFCDPARPAIALPGPEGTRRYEFMLHAGEQDENILDEATARNMIEKCIPCDRDLEIVRKLVYAFHARIADSWRVDRVLLAGDAAHLSPPFAGQGMNSGIRDALNLGWKLAAVVRNDFGAALLDTYQQERKPHAWALIEMAVRIGRFMMPKSTAGAFFMQNALRALSIYPPARDYVMQMKFKPKPRYLDGFVVPDDLGESASWGGRLFIQPRVELADGGLIPLDDAIGKGFVLLEYVPELDSAWRAPQLPAALAARRVRVLPQDYNFPFSEAATDECLIIRDCEGQIGDALRPYRNCAVLLRPDRYVAAVMPRSSALSLGTLPGMRQISRTRSA